MTPKMRRRATLAMMMIVAMMRKENGLQMTIGSQLPGSKSPMKHPTMPVGIPIRMLLCMRTVNGAKFFVTFTGGTVATAMDGVHVRVAETGRKIVIGETWLPMLNAIDAFCKHFDGSSRDHGGDTEDFILRKTAVKRVIHEMKTTCGNADGAIHSVHKAHLPIGVGPSSVKASLLASTLF
jgi:hypothetical protein